MVYEFLGRDDVAAFWYRRATRLDGENYFRPYRPSWDQFQQASREAVSMLPSEASDQLQSARIRVRDLPSRVSGKDQSFLRMCDFVEGSSSKEPLPPIYLYKKNIERVCRDRFDLVEQVYLSLLNEVRILPLINEG